MAPADQVLTVGDSLNATATYSDDGGFADLSVSVTGAPGWVTVTDDGVGTIDFAGTAVEGSWTVTITANDGVNAADVSDSFAINVTAAPGDDPPASSQGETLSDIV